jgi:vacuolar protein sorting-associated protein 13A/C
MLEGLVANLLNRFLGMYVQNFDAKQLNVGIWSGDVKLRNLELRKEALDQLHLPLNVVQGHLGSLTLSIPWSNLRGKPLKVNIEDVFLLAAPKEDAEYDADEEDRRAHAVKMEKLDSAELLKERNTEGMSAEEQQKSQSFTASMVTAIVDNVQITVKNIHIRYEDTIADPGHPFALGVTLADFSAISTDANWKPTFIQGTSESTHKLATLGSLAVYWDTDASLIGTGKGTNDKDDQQIDHDDFIEKLRGMIVRGENPELGDHQFVLKPISGRAGLEMDKTGKADRPKMKARLLFDELGFIIDEDQYRDALMLVDLFHYFIRHQEYKRLQPKSSPKEDPAGWLRFAGKAVLDKIHARNRQWSWDYFRERRDDRVRYIELFKKKKREEKLTPEETEDLDKLERKLTYEDLRFWRSLARNQLRKENVGVKKAPPKQTWSGWIWGSKQEEHHDDDAQLSEQQRKELYDAIAWDEKKVIAESVDMPKEYVKMEVNMSLRTGSFTLKRDPHGEANQILRLLFDSFSTTFLQRTDSMFVKVALEGMRLYDGTTEGSLFPQIITIKDAPPVPDEKRFEELNDDDTSKEDDEEGEEEEKEDPFFFLTFEKNPLDGSADTALTMKLKGMEFVYNPRFVVEVAKFFKPPERHMESIGALMETAGSTVENIRQQTRAGLEFALSEHKTINAQLDLQAPLIIIPDSVTKKSSNCLILDAGHASVTSELVEKDALHEIQAKQRQQYTDEDFRRLEGLMYDKFLLKLHSTQVLIGPSIEETRAQLEENATSKHLHIVDRINMDFKIEICIVPKGSDLTKFRISGNLPVLHASISDAKYKNLMKLIDVAIPKFGDDEPSKEIVEGAKGPSNLKPTNEKKPNPNVDALGRPRSKSFQFGAQEQELVVEEDGDSEKEEIEDTQEAKSTSDAANMHQRNFEFNFTVDKLQGSLYRSDPEGKKPDTLLVELIAEHFDLEFYQAPFEMGAEVRLKTLAVEDHVEENPLPEFRNIITSEDVSEDEQKDLFWLKFVKVNKESPEFTSKYEGIAMNLDVAVSTINLIVTRKTLLTLLDFVLITFTNPGPSQDQQAQITAKEGEQQQVTQQSQVDQDKIRIKAKLKRIAVVLNNDGIRLATLSLSSGDVEVFLNGKAMRIGGRLGSLSLIDDVNQGVSEESPLRQLVTIEGKNLADFVYETFDSELDSYPGYDMSIELKTGSIKINFLTEPFRKIMEFAVKFGKMQAIFNAARQAAANQATQIQERATKMHFDIIISTPIVVFPRMVISDKPDRDTLTANLGEIYANNKFVPLDGSKDSDTANKISAGIRNIKLTSHLHYEEDKSEELQLIDKVDLDFNITMIDHKTGRERPDLEIDGSMSNINLKLTPEQMKFALELSRTIPAAFATEAEEVIEEDVQQELPNSTTEPAKQLTGSKPPAEEPSQDVVSSQGPELRADDDKWTKLDFVFKIGTIGLELIKSKESEPVGDIEAASLSKFSLNDTNVKLRMISDGAMEAELVVQSFSIRDSRTQETNKFRKIMSLINNEVKQQFMASVSISGGQKKNLIALLTIDSPRIILALDYLFALQAFVNAGLATDEPLAIEEEAEEEDADSDNDIMSPDGTRSPEKLPAPEPEAGGMDINFRVNLVDAQVVLIANPASSSSEAIVLGTKQVLVSKQQAMTLQVDKVGMFLCRMDRFDTSRLRILDDFSIQTALDIRNQGSKSSLISITVDIEPLVLRLSLRDIMLAMQIVNRASAMSANDDAKIAVEEPQKIKQGTPSKKAISTKAKSTKPGAKSVATTKRSQHGSISQAPPAAGSAIIKREELHLSIEGIRVVLIGDVHEMPMLDWRVKKFGVDVRDWSGAMTADTSLDTLINVYNFSKSAWEPLIEPWQLGFHMSKDQNPDKLSLELYSRKSMELTVTAATIALASKSFDFLTSEEDILSKPRGTDAPYRIRNYTGFGLDVWAEGKDLDEGYAAKMEDGSEQPWRFEDPSATRETLSAEGATGILGIRLEGSGFDTIPRIPVHREGEVLYNLKPKQNGVQHRILVDVKLGADNIKYVTIRSPLLLENNTQIPIELGIFSPEEGHLLKIEKIAPGDARPAPVGAAYMHSIVIRPDQGFGYTWSNERLHWKDLLKRPTRTITCRGESEDESPPFYFQLHAAFDKKDPLTGVYPYMRLRLAAPVEVQNLLPFDFKYRIYDSNTKKDWTNFLRKGGVSPVHVVELSHLLLISVDMQDTPFTPSKFGIINSTDRESFRREKTLEVKDNNGLTMHLNMHFL